MSWLNLFTLQMPFDMKNIIKKTLYHIGVFFYHQALWNGLKQRPRMQKLYLEIYLLAFDLKYKISQHRWHEPCQESNLAREPQPPACQLTRLWITFLTNFLVLFSGRVFVSAPSRCLTLFNVVYTRCFARIYPNRRGKSHTCFPAKERGMCCSLLSLC